MKKESKKSRIQKLEKRMDDNVLKIKLLHNQNNELKDEANLLDDYREKKEKVKEGRKSAEKLIGRIYWQEDFKDEDSSKVITIERSEICRIDGKPCDKFGNLFEYYNI